MILVKPCKSIIKACEEQKIFVVMYILWYSVRNKEWIGWFLLNFFQQFPVKVLTVALLIILIVYFIRKFIKLFFDKTSFLDENEKRRRCIFLIR